MEQVKQYIDVVVIGSGVSGMTAAIYLKRSNLNVLVVEKDAPGGQINLTASIENYPGFESITGPQLSTSIFSQVQKMKVDYKFGEVLEIVDEGGNKIVRFADEDIICKAIIIASGRKPKNLGVLGEKELFGKGISRCAICDGPFFKEKDVLVVGGGNSAIDETLYLADIVKKVYLVHRRDSFRADPDTVEKVLEKDNVEIIYNSEVLKFNSANGFLNSALLTNNVSKEEILLNVDGAFVFIGFIPNTDYLESLGILSPNKSVEVDINMRTKVKGIYACGDVVEKELYQIVTAASEGATAAVSCTRDLK